LRRNISRRYGVIVLIHLTALIAVLGTAVVYGTDVFCAVVQRPALAAIDDRALVAVMGNIHRYGDRRMPLPGIVGLLAAVASAALATAAGNWAQAVSAGTAVALLVIWLVLYARIAKPINRRLTDAASNGDTLLDARALQGEWDRIIDARAILQGLAVAALCITLMV
jgi:Domain of unknown function (DUF1772)